MTRLHHTRLVLFDLDGTLADSLEAGLEAMNRLRWLFGYPRLDPGDARLRRVTGAAFAKDILGLSVFVLPIWLKLMKFLVSKGAGRIRLYKEWPAVLRRLERKVRWGIITSGPERYARTILDGVGLDGFSVLIADVPYHRKAKAILKALSETDVPPREALYVGDEIRDMEASRDCGVPFAAVGWGKDHEELFLARRRELAGLIRTPAEILDIGGLSWKRNAASTSSSRVSSRVCASATTPARWR